MYIALDIGGTYTRIGSFESTGPDTSLGIRKIKTKQSYLEAMDDIKKVVLGITGKRNIDGVGISIASPVDKEGKITPANLPKWRGKKPATFLGNFFDCPVMIINDGVAGAMAEVAYGESGWDEFAYIIWGTGVGGVNVKPADGTFEIFPVEPGHYCLHEGGRLCRCGKRGCIEAYIGGRSIEDFYKKPMKDLTSTEWDVILEYATDSFYLLSKLFKTNKIVVNGGTVLKNPKIIGDISKNMLKKYGLNLQFRICKIGDEASLYGALLSLDPHIL